MELFKILGTIALEGKEKFKEDTDKATQDAKRLSEAIGNDFQKAAKIGWTALGTAAAAVGALIKKSFGNYAEYEQLVGGVDTLFKNSSKKVQQYAANAYKTAGMSANDYMKSATAFSASLISSLGGDTEAAAEYANRAMISMSDNANKMGTSIDSVVQTYQSLARGNFAMLDNLKLGYGGTKAELERLIADAASYTDVQREMGITVDATSTSFDNIVNAIAVVQGHLGIAGATLAEAESTIEGSLNATKAAWSNLVTGIADENADLSMLISNFADSAGIALNNILPRIEQIFKGLQTVREEVPAIDFLATAFEGVATVLIASKIGEGIGNIVSAVKNAQGVFSAFYAVVAAHPFVAVATALGTVAFAAKNMVDNTVDALAGTATSYEEAAAKVDELKSKIEEFNNIDPAYWTDQTQSELDMYRLALTEAEGQLSEFEAAQKEAAEVSAETTEEMAAQGTAAVEGFVEDTESILTKFQETYAKISQQVGSWFKPFSAAGTEVKTSVDEMMAAMQSQVIFNNNYAASLENLGQYGLGSLSEALQSYGSDGAAYAQTIVEAVESAGGATSEAGQKIIEEFQAIQEQVATSQSALAETMTALSLEMFPVDSDNPVSAMAEVMAQDTSMTEAGTDAVTEAASRMKSAVETAGFDSAGKTAMTKFATGINSMSSVVMAAVNSIANAAVARMNQALQQIQAMAASAAASIPSHAMGLNYVPYDNYLAYLHKGEAVLTAEEATAWRAGKTPENITAIDSTQGQNGGNGGGWTINQYIETVPQTPVEFAAATEAYFEQARWAMA